MAQQYIGGGGTERPVDAGAGEKQAAGGGVMGVAGHMAHQYMGGGEGAHVAEGGEKAQPGLVDRLLSMYSESTGKPVSWACGHVLDGGGGAVGGWVTEGGRALGPSSACS